MLTIVQSCRTYTLVYKRDCVPRRLLATGDRAVTIRDRCTRSSRRSYGLARFTIRLGARIALPRFPRSRDVFAEFRARKRAGGERAEGVVTSREIRPFSW